MNFYLCIRDEIRIRRLPLKGRFRKDDLEFQATLTVQTFHFHAIQFFFVELWNFILFLQENKVYEFGKDFDYVFCYGIGDKFWNFFNPLSNF